MAESDADKILRLEADLDEALDLIDKYENDDSTAKRLTDAERQLEILSREKHDFEDRFNSLFGERAQLEDDLRERDRALANATAEREASEALIKDIRRQLNAAQEEVERCEGVAFEGGVDREGVGLARGSVGERARQFRVV